jgi:hypothetical protein
VLVLGERPIRAVDVTPLPFVRAALLCERVLCETDGALSAIRILHEGRPTTVDSGPTKLVLLVMLVRGEAQSGPHRASLQICSPAGQVISSKQIAFVIDEGGPEQSSSLVLDVSFEPRTVGVYWFRVLWGDGDRLLTQVPYTARVVVPPSDGAPRARD